MIASRPHSVYRCYDRHDTLLYIGCARNVDGRIGTHNIFGSRNVNSWFIRQHMTRCESVEYPDLSTARDEEKKAIRAEAPLLNVHHNLGRAIDRHIITSVSVQEQTLFLDRLAAERAA